MDKLSEYMDNFWNKHNIYWENERVRKYFDKKYLHKINPYFDMHLKEFKKILCDEEDGKFDYLKQEPELDEWKKNFDEIVYFHLWNEMVVYKRRSFDKLWLYDSYEYEYYEMRFFDVYDLHERFNEYIEDIMEK